MCLNVYMHMQVGIDLVGPLPKTARGNCYIITLVDYFSKWPEAAPLPDKSARSVALFLYKMMCRYTCMYNNGRLVNAAFSINIGMGVQKLSYQTKEGSLLTKSVVSCIP